MRLFQFKWEYNIKFLMLNYDRKWNFDAKINVRNKIKNFQD